MSTDPKRTCPGCQQSFLAQFSYQQWCWSCWRGLKAQEEARAKNTKAAFKELFSDFREACYEAWCLRQEVQRLNAVNAELQLQLLEAQARKNPTESDLASQLRRQMPRLLQALHPDKNSSPASHELTVWLLQVKRQLS